MSLQNDSNIDPSLQNPPSHSLISQLTPSHTQDQPGSESPQKWRRAGRTTRKSVDISTEGSDSVQVEGTSPKAKRARPSPIVKNVGQNDSAHLLPVSEFAHPIASPGIPHMIPQFQAHASQPPTAPMNYAPQPHQMISPASLLAAVSRRLLPPKHETAVSLTSYLSHVIARSSAPFIPETINTSFTLPWSFGVPRDSLTVPITPGSKLVPIRDLLHRLTLRIVQEEPTVNVAGGDDQQKDKEMEALVNLARKSMDVQNCLLEVSMSLVKMVQTVDGFVYSLNSAARVPVTLGEQSDQIGQGGVLGGDWDFTFLCNCSEEAQQLPRTTKDEEMAEPVDAKYFACQGRILIGYLEQEESIVLKYRHYPIHPSSGEVKPPSNPPERVGTRKSPQSTTTQSPHPNGSTAVYPHYYGTQQSSQDGFVQLNGQWYYPDQPPAAGLYSQQHPQQPSLQRPRDQQAEYTHQGTPLPAERMTQIYCQAATQFAAPATRRRRGRSKCLSQGDASTEQRLLEELSKELAQHPSQAPSHSQSHVLPHANVKQMSGEHVDDEGRGRNHPSPLGEEQHAHRQQREQQQQYQSDQQPQLQQSPPPQGHDYSTQYPFSSTIEYPHSTMTSLAGTAEVANGGNSGQGEGSESLEGNTLSDHRGSDVDADAGVRELVQQLVQQANANVHINAIGGSPPVTTPAPIRSESPEPKRRRTRAKANSAS